MLIKLNPIVCFSLFCSLGAFLVCSSRLYWKRKYPERRPLKEPNATPETVSAPKPPSKEMDFQRLLSGLFVDVLRTHAAQAGSATPQRLWEELQPFLPRTDATEEIVKALILYFQRIAELVVTESAVQTEMLRDRVNACQSVYFDLLEHPLDVPERESNPEDLRHQFGIKLLTVRIEQYVQELLQNDPLRANNHLAEAVLLHAEEKVNALKAKQSALATKSMTAKAGAVLLTAMDGTLLALAMLTTFQATGEVTPLQILGIALASAIAAMGLTQSALLGIVKPYIKRGMQWRYGAALFGHVVLSFSLSIFRDELFGGAEEGFNWLNALAFTLIASGGAICAAFCHQRVVSLHAKMASVDTESDTAYELLSVCRAVCKVHELRTTWLATEEKAVLSGVVALESLLKTQAEKRVNKRQEALAERERRLRELEAQAAHLQQQAHKILADVSLNITLRQKMQTRVHLAAALLAQEDLGLRFKEAEQGNRPRTFRRRSPRRAKRPVSVALYPVARANARPKGARK